MDDFKNLIMGQPEESFDFDELMPWHESYLSGENPCYDVKVARRWSDSLVGVYAMLRNALNHD